MTKETPDRSDLHVGLQVAFWFYPSGAAQWNTAFLEIDLDSIQDPDSPSFLQFRKIVPESTISTSQLLQMGKRSRMKGVATTVREIQILLSNGRTAMILPPAGADRYQLDSIMKPVAQPAFLVSQGRNSCWLDVTLFLSACFNLGRQRRDAQTLGSLYTSTRTQITFRYVMYHLFQALQTESAQIQHNNKLRDVLLDTMSEEYRHIKAGGMNDLGDGSDHCWQGLNSLSYTYINSYMCCDGRRILGPKTVAHRRTTHSLQLERTFDRAAESSKGIHLHRSKGKKRKRHSTQQEVLHPGKTLGQVVSNRYFDYPSQEASNRDLDGNMRQPFAPCSSTCTQLPRKMVVILDDLPNYLTVTIDHGSPLQDDQIRRYAEPLRLEHYLESAGRITISHWVLCGVGLHIPGLLHFVGRAYSPPGFPKYEGLYCAFDGMKSAEPTPLKVNGLLQDLPVDVRVTLLMYRREV